MALPRGGPSTTRMVSLRPFFVTLLCGLLSMCIAAADETYFPVRLHCILLRGPDTHPRNNHPHRRSPFAVLNPTLPSPTTRPVQIEGPWPAFHERNNDDDDVPEQIPSIPTNHASWVPHVFRDTSSLVLPTPRLAYPAGPSPQLAQVGRSPSQHRVRRCSRYAAESALDSRSYRCSHPSSERETSLWCYRLSGFASIQ